MVGDIIKLRVKLVLYFLELCFNFSFNFLMVKGKKGKYVIRWIMFLRGK